jgi:uncharacterized protein
MHQAYIGLYWRLIFKFKWIYFFGFLLICLTQVYAASNQDLYQASVPVASQSLQDRQQAFSTALAQVLVKLSGRTEVLTSRAIANQLPKASDYVQSFSYVVNPSAVDKKSRYQLQVSFDVDALNHLLKTNDIALRVVERPKALMWLAVKQQQNIVLVGSEDSDNIAQLIFQAAQKRNISIFFPSYDLTDLERVDVTDVWLNNISVIEQAAQRYHVAPIVIGQLQETAQHTWQGQWLLSFAEQQWHWDVNGQTVEDVIAKGINQLTDKLQEQIMNGTVAINDAIVPMKTMQNEIILRVTHVDTMKSYHDVSNYLRRLVMVKSVDLIRVDSSDVVLKLVLNANTASFLEVLDEERILIPMYQTSVTMPMQDSTMEYVYQWTP